MTLYTSKGCAYCPQVKKLLNNKQVTYDEVVIDDNLDEFQKAIELTGALTVPQLINGNKFAIGLDIPSIMKMI